MSKRIELKGSNPALEAWQRAIKEVIEEHRRPGEPMVISTRAGIIQ